MYVFVSFYQLNNLINYWVCTFYRVHINHKQVLSKSRHILQYFLFITWQPGIPSYMTFNHWILFIVSNDHWRIRSNNYQLTNTKCNISVHQTHLISHEPSVPSMTPWHHYFLICLWPTIQSLSLWERLSNTSDTICCVMRAFTSETS